ncbi:SIMPL domain-containing protein [Methylorubrum populi]|uniref:Outer membrane protein n=1 Tax=Methylorubrum populi TaxID=223967 RepID=A0A833JA52_9HYPH|nr:SIMPL domain-containing protein [Methylorubrum populi]KAB7787696.1 Outer membrane protein [Methylorubrum populi]
MKCFALAGSLLLLAVASPAAADDESGRIRVIGRASQEVAPDFASVEIGVESRGATPAAALDAASQAAKGIVATAKEMGVAEADIGTSAVTLQPRIKNVRLPDGTMGEREDGYTASNRVRVRLAEMGKLGELMRRTLDSGANRIQGISFGLRDPAAADAAVQVAAVKDAKAQAERIAEATGVKLGSVISIDSPPRTESPRPMPYGLAMKAAAPRGRTAVPVEAGSIETSAEVDAVFAIGR